MNIAEFSIKKDVITWALTAVLIVAGWASFSKLSRLEDPEFTIKEALITTPYPGASAEEVEEEVSDLIERAAQELGQVLRVESTSSRGVSVVKAVIKDQYDKQRLPQVWDELRRKVNDYQTQLPPGAGPSIVNDDFGDVYGIYVAVTGEGYSFAEIKEYAKLLRREMLLVDDVKRIVIWGDKRETVFVEMSRPKMAALGVSQTDIYQTLAAKNLPADSGRVALHPEYIAINPSGEFESEQEFGELLIKGSGGEGGLVFLKDVAVIRRGYEDPPRKLLRFNGKPAIGLGVSTAAGGNVVKMGEGLGRKLEQLKSQSPVGMELNIVSLQSKAVTIAINAFMINLLEAVVIVVVVLLLFMGLRSALIIGFILFLTISGSFIFMGYWGIVLERISLGALIIALGMLVDNAIVVVEGMKIKMDAGQDPTKAAGEVVGQQSMPLLGATIVAIMAFAAIGTSDDSTGEYCRSLFQVIAISLGLSWVTAVTVTPLVCKIFLKRPEPGAGDEAAADPYAGGVFRLYRSALAFCIRARPLTLAVVAGLFALAVFGFRYVDSMFFPNSTRPQFLMEFYFPEGTHIRDTEASLAKAEEYLMGLDEVTDVSTAIGGGDLRFLLTYTPIAGGSGNAVMFAGVHDWRVIDALLVKVGRDLAEIVPGANIALKKFRLGPGDGGQIQLRISGPEREALREMSERVKTIMREEGAQAVRDEWRERVKVLRPLIAEAQARRLGLDRPEVADALRAAFDGSPAGVYRERDELLPILARAPEYERESVQSVRDVQIWSPAAEGMIPLSQVLEGFETVYEDANIWRRNRVSTMKIHCDPVSGELPSVLLGRIKPRVEQELDVDFDAYFLGSTGPRPQNIPVKNSDQIPLKDLPGYFIAWGGEAESGAKAQVALASSIPVFVAIMILTVVFLFNAVRQPLIIWLTVPLAIIGVTAGLLLFRQPFGFMALLGMLSLSGMLIKNAIVLIDEIDTQIRSGKDRLQAVLDSGVSRTRPVMMAALTTILGMLPLLQDAFFIAMAVTIMFGLLFASLLTLIVVPVLYTLLFRIPRSAA